MSLKYIFTTLLFLSFSLTAFSQADVAVRILKAEDERRYDVVLEDLLKNANPVIRARAALAAGRIGDERAVSGLAELLESGDEKVRTAAAFAIGEIESIKAAETILKSLNDPKTPDPVRAKLVEAAGKIAAANAKDEKSKELAKAILDTLEAENRKGVKQNREVVLMGITAALRARPEKTGVVVAKFLTNPDARVRADAANTLSRVRAKNANEALRSMLINDADPIARANAARALGAAEDKEAFDALLKAATGDADSRVRISAIRSIGSLKHERAVQPLENYQAAIMEQVVKRDAKLLAGAKYYAPPAEQNEWLEITTALGNILAGRKDATKPSKDGGQTIFETAPQRLQQLIMNAPETSIARAKISPEFFMFGFLERFRSAPKPIFKDWRSVSSLAQGLGVVATLPKEKYSEDLVKYRTEAQEILRLFMADKSVSPMAMPDVLRAFALFKTDDASTVLRNYLRHEDVFIRAAAAELLADLPAADETTEALKTAFSFALANDKDYNDAQLAILDTVYKLDKKESGAILLESLKSYDYLVRTKALELLKDETVRSGFSNSGSEHIYYRAKETHRVQPYSPRNGSKLGQILNTAADYRRAALRKNGKVKAILATEKGTFTIDLLPEDAPLTVDNFIKLAKSGYFNGLEVHRVVPNFVMQDGDPRGDGNGGPGWSIRCELNTVPFERGAVGMALSGKDTGGSQWFVTHAPQPHLDGGYTVFGRLNETGMKIVDNIVRGDKIISVKIVEGGLPQRTQRARSRK
ncbi:MAG: peptidylprolyl isomerase [Saprospiraceae bacterium]|nr:peptidylprolyl isomerase [Pyrinomonadaceae bacterium]